MISPFLSTSFPSSSTVIIGIKLGSLEYNAPFHPLPFGIFTPTYPRYGEYGILNLSTEKSPPFSNALILKNACNIPGALLVICILGCIVALPSVSTLPSKTISSSE